VSAGIQLDHLDEFLDCQVSQLSHEFGSSTPPSMEDCAEFETVSAQIQATLIFVWQVTAFSACREAEPRRASARWKQCADLCERYLTELQKVRQKFPMCGSESVYNLGLELRARAMARYEENLEDAEWPGDPTLEALFPIKTGQS
jgi:hypothetical protein